MGERTKVAKAHSKSQSLRTTIPNGASKTLDLENKDELDWKETTAEGRPAYLITKVDEKATTRN